MKKLLVTLGLALFASAVAEAQTASLNPTADTFVSAANPTSNYGGAGALEVSGSGTAKGAFDFLLKFDLSTARASFDALYGPGLWTIQSITLQLTAATPGNTLFNSNAAGQIDVQWLLSDAWIEGNGTPMAGNTGSGAITYNTLPGIRGSSDETLGTYAFGGATGNTTWALGLTPGFSADAQAGNSVSLLVLPTAGDTTVSDLSNSRTFGTTTQRPLLTVVAVPEPGCGALLLAGALTWGVSRRRRVRHG